MAYVALYRAYRPQKFCDVVGQQHIIKTLQNAIKLNKVAHAYLFCGPRGTGKTTCARIFANEINKGKGSPIELDAASNNSVDDVREIIQHSKTASLDSEYKIFILDEVHALSNSAWQAMLKILEEPPAKSIFIMCTTDPQKIPKTILSRVQRYDFQRISKDAIIRRLMHVLIQENLVEAYSEDGLDYIAKKSSGGMRDALTMLDKCLAYSTELTLDNVLKALGVTDYDTMTDFLYAYQDSDRKQMIDILNKVYMSGADLKQFIKDLSVFVLDLCKYVLQVDETHLSCPVTADIETLFETIDIDQQELLRSLINLQTEIKWDTNPKARIEAWCMTGE